MIKILLIQFFSTCTLENLLLPAAYAIRSSNGQFFYLLLLLKTFMEQTFLPAAVGHRSTSDPGCCCWGITFLNGFIDPFKRGGVTPHSEMGR